MAELLHIDDILSPKVAVQVRAPVGILNLVPLDAGLVKVGQAQLEEVERELILKEEAGCCWDLCGFGKLGLARSDIEVEMIEQRTCHEVLRCTNPSFWSSSDSG